MIITFYQKLEGVLLLSVLAKKRARLKGLKKQAEQIQIKLRQLEGEIQMLTESLNSQDPQLLKDPLNRL